MREKEGTAAAAAAGRGKISQRVEDTAGGVGREIVKDKAGDRAITTKKEMHRQRECLVESPWHLYSLHSGIPSGSLQDLFSRCLQKCVDRERGTRVGAGVRRANQGRVGGRRWGTRAEETAQCARGSRDIVTPFLLPFCIPPPPPPPTAPYPSEATEILETPLCFWLLERAKIPARKLHSGHGGSLKMFRKRRTARIIHD